MAADLAETAKADGTTADAEFWYATAAKLLAPLFFAAARDRRSMADVVRWVDTQEGSEVSSILEQAGVAEALDAARLSGAEEGALEQFAQLDELLVALDGSAGAQRG